MRTRPLRLLATVIVATAVVPATVSAQPAAATCGDPCMTAHGGPVEASSGSVLVAWNDSVDPGQLAAVGGFLGHVGGLGYLDGLNAYGVGHHAAYLGRFTLGEPTSGTVTDGDIQAALTAAGSTLPAPSATTNYVVMLPPGTSVTRGSAASLVDFCSYHAQTAAATPMNYAVLPDYGSVPPGGACPKGSSPSAVATMNAARTLLGMLTDPDGNGWHDATGNEVADPAACPTEFNGRSSAVSDNGFAVPLYWSEHDQSCTSGNDGLQLVKVPPTETRSTTTTITWSYVDGLGTTPTLTCQFDHRATTDCTGKLSRTFAGLADGGHSFAVTLADGSQTLGHTEVSWIVNTFKPRTITNPKPAAYFERSSHPSFTYYQYTQGAQTAYYDLRYRQATLSSGFTAWATPTGGHHRTSTSITITGISTGETVCLESRATDTLGNVGPWSAQACTARVVDDQSPLVHHPPTSHWTRGKASGYYFDTYTRTSRRGQVLTVSGRGIRRVAIVVTLCPRCGTLVASFAGHKDAIGLYSKKTMRNTIISLRPFARTDVTLTLRTTGGPVTIDGIGLSHT